MARWVGGDGFEVEAIRLDGHTLLRVRQYGFLVAYCRSIAEVARYVRLDDLVELVTLPVAGARTRG
ncbi:transposase [Sphaerisporangium sp. B11E5]|uniref:transposase n=1 Tax=Sphaerisporangium sp. B11E5 TaxID=3153563 RepID=UPI00325EC57E